MVTKSVEEMGKLYPDDLGDKVKLTPEMMQQFMEYFQNLISGNYPNRHRVRDPYETKRWMNL
jgi:hypothetical protein